MPDRPALSGVYAGIGSRQAPGEILMLCRQVAIMLRSQGWHLRSGHAIGCDQAFERGAGEDATIYLPWKDYENEVPIDGRVVPVPTIPALEVAHEYHPAPEKLSMASFRLMGRNSHIILGDDLKSPVDRVICWTKTPTSGGTSQALRIAAAYDIPVFNLADPLIAAEFKRACAEALPT